jgi:hypothetical protein
MQNNENLEKSIKSYLELEEPQYGILLTGKWGSGKTYFLNKFIEDNYKDNNCKKFIKISLFGIKSTAEIDEQIFISLYTKKAFYGTKFVSGILKKGTGFDIFGDKKPDFKVGIELDDFNIFSSKTSSKELIFVFDDFERTELSIASILGYINELVESSKFKVIIITDETEIKEQKEYKDFKEKIIGRTFEIQTNFLKIFKHFLASATESESILEENIDSIEEVYKLAKHNNLRHIRQTILDFEDFYSQLNENFKNHNYFKIFIKEFFAISIEIKSGKLEIGDDLNKAKSLQEQEVKRMVENISLKRANKEEKPPVEYSETHKRSLDFLRKYKYKAIDDFIFYKLIYELLKYNFEILDSTKKVFEQFENGFYSETHFSSLLNLKDKESFENAINYFLEKLKGEKCSLSYIVKVVNRLIELSSKDLLDKTENELIECAVSNTKTALEDIRCCKEFIEEQYFPYGYNVSLDKELKESTMEVIEQHKDFFLKDAGNKFLEHLKNEKLRKYVLFPYDEQCRNFCENSLNKIDIFKHFNAQDVLDILLEIKSCETITYFKYFIVNNTSINLKTIFWKEFKSLLEKSIVNIGKSEKLKIYHLKELLNVVKDKSSSE